MSSRTAHAILRAGLARPPLYLTLVYERLLSLLRPRLQGFVRGEVIDGLSARIVSATHSGIDLRFLCPNQTTVIRATSFSEKEPETLEWIDSFPDGSVLWDVGANVGNYAIYAAKRHPGVRVVAFEPSVFNTDLLVRNVALNGVERRVCVVPLPLFERSGENTFNLSTLDRGGALSAFGVDHDHAGKRMTARLSYSTIGLSLDDAAARFGLERPNFIKMDVDGIEHLILRGGTGILSDPALRSILIEINDDFAVQRDEAASLLTAHGFELAVKRQFHEITAASEFGQTFNNIWIRDNMTDAAARDGGARL